MNSAVLSSGYITLLSACDYDPSTCVCVSVCVTLRVYCVLQRVLTSTSMSKSNFASSGVVFNIPDMRFPLGMAIAFPL